MDEQDKEMLRDGRTVVVFGSINQDLSVACERVPRAGETLHGHDFISGAGGKGANQAVAAARMGAVVHMVGAVGADVFGDALVAGLERDGIGCACVERREDTSTGVAIILRSDGDNRIVLSAGANTALSPAQACKAVDVLFERGDACVGSVFLAQGECDLDATAAPSSTRIVAACTPSSIRRPPAACRHRPGARSTWYVSTRPNASRFAASPPSMRRAPGARSKPSAA